MLMPRWNACEIWLIPMTSELDWFSCLFWHFSLMIVPSEIFNPYPFIVGIERPDAKLFMSITEDIASQRKFLVPSYDRGLHVVTIFLSKAAPLNDLYLYLRDHPLQNPAKAKVHCEHGFASLRLAVKAYLEVSFQWLSFPFLYVLIPYRRNANISFRKFVEGHFIVFWRDLTLTVYIYKVGKLSCLFSLCRPQARRWGNDFPNIKLPWVPNDKDI